MKFKNSEGSFQLNIFLENKDESDLDIICIAIGMKGEFFHFAIFSHNYNETVLLHDFPKNDNGS